MIYDLLKERKKIDIAKYTLKDLALYFEKYHGYTCKIETTTRMIKFKIDKSYFPHLIGIHHAFYNHKDKNRYKGISGFELLKGGKITYDDIRKGLKNNTKATISWRNIKNRIEYLPMFMNTLANKTKFRVMDLSKIYKNTKMQGNFVLFKIVKSEFGEVYPLLTLKEIKNSQIVIETFIVELDVGLIGALEEEQIISIELIDQFVGTSPLSYIKEKILL